MSLPQLIPPADSSELLWSQDEALARMFAANSKFQAEVGTVGDVAATLNNHVIDWAAIDPDDSDFKKARILIEYSSGNRKYDGAWTTNGALSVCLERKQPALEDTSAGYRAAKNSFMRFFSSVMTEFEERSKAVSESILGFNPRRFSSYDLLTGPQWVPESETYQDPDQDTDQAGPQSLWYIELNFNIS